MNLCYFHHQEIKDAVNHIILLVLCRNERDTVVTKTPCILYTQQGQCMHCIYAN